MCVSLSLSLSLFSLSLSLSVISPPTYVGRERLQAPENEGGLRDWFDLHCGAFAGHSKDDEHRPEFFELYREFERRVSAALEAFVAAEFGQDEGSAKLAELHDEIRRGLDEPPAIAPSKEQRRFDGAVNMLLAAADYKKFCSIMRMRAKASASSPPAGVRQPQSHSWS